MQNRNLQGGSFRPVPEEFEYGFATVNSRMCSPLELYRSIRHPALNITNDGIESSPLTVPYDWDCDCDCDFINRIGEMFLMQGFPK